MKVIVQGLATEYDDRGAGPVILMLHGWKDDLKTFNALMPELARAHRVVRLDFPGHGSTELPPVAWTVEDFARFVEVFLEKVQISPEVVIGHSLGGRVILKGVGEDIFGAHKVVLIASAGNAIRNTSRNRVYWIVAKVGKVITSVWPFSLLRSRLRKKLYAAAKSDYLTAGQMTETFVNVISEDLSEDAAKVTVPTLLIWGTKDETTPFADGERMLRTLPHAEMKAIEGAGHFVHRTHADAVSEAILSFI